MTNANGRVLVAAVLALVAAATHRRAVALGRRRRIVHRFAPPATRSVRDRLPSAPRWLVRFASRLGANRRAARVQAALPEALEGIARTLRTGGSLRQAVSEAARDPAIALRDDLGIVAAQVARGAPVALAFETWAERCPLPSVRLAVAALALGADTGGAQARAIDGVAATIRERLAAAADVHAHATQARLSGVVIALSPIAFCVLSTATDARTAAFLFRTPPGLVLLAAGLALDALGAVWMNRITRVVA